MKGDLQIHTPSNLTDEEASTLGIAITTIGQGLYQQLGLALPTSPTADKKTPILIYGGSTAMGITGIQFAALSGYTVITTASPHNHEYLRSLGATHVLDYHSPTAPAEIRALTGNALGLAWDCQSDRDSAAFCARSLSEEKGGRYAALLFGVGDAVTAANPKAEAGVTLYYSVFGEPYFYKDRFPPKQADFEFGKMFWELGRGLLEEGKIRPIRPIINRGGAGLEGVLVGMEELKAGKVSAGKLVYTL